MESASSLPFDWYPTLKSCQVKVHKEEDVDERRWSQFQFDAMKPFLNFMSGSDHSDQDHWNQVTCRVETGFTRVRSNQGCKPRTGILWYQF